jgi:NTP pyrophosphatase (non-canonical NTP hydrolase)
MRPIITSNTLDSSTLDEWLEEFLYIYGHRDKDLSLEQMWMKAVEDSAKVGEGVRENKGDDVVEYLSKTFCWTVSFTARLLRDEKIDNEFNIRQAPISDYKIDSLTRLVFFKYPTICPRCLRASCICPILLKDPYSVQQRQDKLKSARRDNAPPQTMNEIAQMFARIYDTAHFIKSIEEVCFHYLEEVGEVARAMRRLRAKDLDSAELLARRQNLVEELADVISWTFSLARKKHAELEDFAQFVTIDASCLGSLSLQRMLWKTYGDNEKNRLRCPICGKRKCLPTCEKK